MLGPMISPNKAVQTNCLAQLWWDLVTEITVRLVVGPNAGCPWWLYVWPNHQGNRLWADVVAKVLFPGNGVSWAHLLTRQLKVPMLGPSSVTVYGWLLGPMFIHKCSRYFVPEKDCRIPGYLAWICRIPDVGNWQRGVRYRQKIFGISGYVAWPCGIPDIRNSKPQVGYWQEYLAWTCRIPGVRNLKRYGVVLAKSLSRRARDDWKCTKEWFESVGDGK